MDKDESKNIPLGEISSIEGPNFEKKTGRRRSVFGGGDIEDGHVIRLMQSNGFSIDLKVCKLVSSSYLLFCMFKNI